LSPVWWLSPAYSTASVILTGLAGKTTMHRGGRRGRLRWLFGFDDHEHHSGPWGWRGRFFQSGEVRLALLSLLSEGPRHGYELMKEMEARSGGMYRASAGTVYPNLQQLEDEGLVRSETDADGKRVYVLTDEGKAELEREAASVKRIWSRASTWDDWRDAFSPGAQEVMGPAMRLARAAFLAAAKGDGKEIERVRAVLNKAADELEKATGTKKE
jgi:DNA-binding PadR family transcriptional regulator